MHRSQHWQTATAASAFAVAVTLSLASMLVSVPSWAAETQAAEAGEAAGESLRTPAGNGVTAPSQWSHDASGTVLRFDAPEGDLHIALVDVGSAADASAAAQAAWAAYDPTDRHPLKLITAMAPKNGWEERQSIDYETSANEHLVLFAIALRRGSVWTVLIADGSESTFEKRGAAVNLIAQSLSPAGYKRETFVGRPAHALDASRIAAMEDFVARSIAELGVPGASFALYDHGRVVYEGGVGLRELGRSERADAHTRYMIASNTKGMSTLLLSELVDAGKLAWDEPVVKVYPDFRLGDPETTRSAEIRHLVCACTGLPRTDFLWLFNTSRDTPASTTFAQLAENTPTSKFGEVFQYNNLMASAAGYVAGHLYYPDLELGAAYDKAMQAHIFDPLGMGETTLSMERGQTGNFASPHGDDIDGKPTLAAMDLNYAIEPYRPAGGAWSSAHDLIRYVALELNQGLLPDGKRLVSAQNLLARRARGVSTGENQWYGMGLMDDATWGVSVIHHGGSMGGYKSDILLIPEASVGAVILTNSDNGQMLLRPFRRRLLELLYDGKPEAAAEVAASAAQTRAEIAKDRERLVLPAETAVTSRLAASYVSPDLGTITVNRDASGTRFTFTAWDSTMASRRNDDGTFSLVTVDPTEAGIEFVVGPEVDRPTLTTRDGQHTYVFMPR